MSGFDTDLGPETDQEAEDRDDCDDGSCDDGEAEIEMTPQPPRTSRPAPLVQDYVAHV